MPTVPGYGDPRTGERPLPAVRVDPRAPIENFGGGRGAEESFEAAKALADVGFKAQEDANAARLSEKRRAFFDWEKANIHDPKTGARWKLGKNAIGVSVQLGKSFDDFVGEQGKDLANQSQREAFRSMAEARRAYVMNWADGHEGEQIIVHRISERQAGIESSKERASLDPATVPLELRMIQDNVADIADAKGWGPEETAAELRKQEEDLHLGVIYAMLAGKDSIGAQRYFDRVKGSIGPDALPQLAGRLERATKEDTVRADSQREATRIIEGDQTVEILPGQPVRVVGTPPAKTLAEALERARKIKDPEVQDATVQRVKQRWDELVEAQREAHGAVVREAANAVEMTGSTSSISADTWMNKLDQKERTALEERAGQLRKREPSVTTEEGWRDYYRLKDMAARADQRKAFLAENLMLYRSKWSDAEFKDLVTDQAALKKGDEQAQKKLDGWSSRAEIWRSTLTAEGFFQHTEGSSLDEKNRKERDQIRRMVDAEVRKREGKLKEEIPNKEFQEIVDELLRESVNGKKLYQVELELQQPGINMIPEADRKMIKEELALLGFHVTEERIKATYRLRLRKDYGYPR